MLAYLKKSLYLLLLLATTAVWANDGHHFIYIQSEKGELFYVRYNGKVLSASSKGYVIVPEIPKGTAQIIIGFPKNEIPEKQFLISLTGTRDEGFVIKHTTTGDIALFNLQSYTLLKPTTADAPVAAAETPASTTPAENATPVVAAAQTTPGTRLDSTNAMMGNVKKDLDSAFANKQDVVVSGGPATTPAVTTTAPVAATTAAKQPSKFASALDKVVSDDRPVEVEEEKPAVTPAATPAATDATTTAPVADATAVKKVKKKAKTDTKDPLTDDEKVLLADVMAEEQKTAATETPAAAPVAESTTPATVTTTPPAETPAPATQTPATTPAETPVTVTPEATTPVATTDAEPSKKKKKKHSDNDPQFIDFNAPATAAATTATTATDAAVAAPEVSTKASRKKKKQQDAAVTDAPVVTDSAAVTAPVETPKPSRKKKQKHTDDAATTDSSTALKSDEWVTVNKNNTTATPAATATDADAKPVTKDAAINSDCKQTLNGEGFKKLVKKVSGQGNESGMVEIFNKNVRNTCLSVDQIRAIAQLIDTDEYRYKLLEVAYQHTYESGNFTALQDLLKDDYYKKRFKAMLR